MRTDLYKVPENKKIRVIIDTDAYAEGDDQYALVHALLTPKFEVVGIIAEQFGIRDGNDSMEKSYMEIQKIINLMGLRDQIPVFHGAESALVNEETPMSSEGARFIIEQAFRDDKRPLFVLNLGAVTNLASAYLLNPEIGGRLTAIWIGGGAYPIGMLDFNAGNDLHAANVLLASKIELWQVPFSAYTMMEVSFHELYQRVQPYGAIGDYLFHNLLRVNELECAKDFSHWPWVKSLSEGAKTMVIRSGEGWSLGDNPAVGVLITNQGKGIEYIKAQRMNPDGTYGELIDENRVIRVYTSVDSRIILEDLFSKIKYYYGESANNEKY